MRTRGVADREAGGYGVAAAQPARMHARGEGPTGGWGSEGLRGAHPKHVGHACEAVLVDVGRDAGRFEAQRLVERRRFLPRVEKRAYDAG